MTNTRPLWPLLMAHALAVLLLISASIVPSCDGDKKRDGWNRSTNGVWDD